MIPDDLTTDDSIRVPRVEDSAEPRDVVCPVCNAQLDRPCTTETDFGRREVRWTHFARDERARGIHEGA